MTWPESFTPKRRFTADSRRSPACAAIESGAASRRPATKLAGPGQPGGQAARRRSPRQGPDSAPDHVFFGDTRGQSFGPPMRAPAEIGGDVGRPDDDEDEEDRRPAERLGLPQHDEAGARDRDVEQAEPDPAQARDREPRRERDERRHGDQPDRPSRCDEAPAQAGRRQGRRSARSAAQAGSPGPVMPLHSQNAIAATSSHEHGERRGRRAITAASATGASTAAETIRVRSSPPGRATPACSGANDASVAPFARRRIRAAPPRTARRRNPARAPAGRRARHRRPARAGNC